MIDLANETILTFAEAAKRVPSCRKGRPTNRATLFRWALQGTRGVHLEYIKLGGRLLTSAEALQRYGDRVAEVISKGMPMPVADACPPTATRRKAVDRADQELAAAGL